jgi:hypothetical protein
VILDSLTGVTITIIEIADDGTTASVAVDNQPCINGTRGFYRYYFAGMQDEYFFNPNDTRAIIASGFVDRRLNNLDGAISDIRGGGGFSVNLSGVTGSISNLGKLVKEENEKIKEHIDKRNNETKSHIDIAKNSIIDTIETIEMPEIPETDLSNITEWIGVLKARFTTLQKWLKEEQKKEMEEKDKENEWKMSELQQKIDEMEEVYEEMQNLSASEVKEKQTLIDEMEETAKEIMEELEKEKVVNKEATEKEIKDKIISSLSE